MYDFDPEQYKRRRYKKQRNDVGFEQVRKQCLARDKYKCKMCGSKKSLQVHHIIRHSDSIALRNELSNIISLCRVCHTKVTGNERHYIEYLHGLIK